MRAMLFSALGAVLLMSSASSASADEPTVQLLGEEEDGGRELHAGHWGPGGWGGSRSHPWPLCDCRR